MVFNYGHLGSDVIPRGIRNTEMFRSKGWKLTQNHSAKFGGREAFLRRYTAKTWYKSGLRFKNDRELVDVARQRWASQQYLRKEWKSRDWDMVEVPFAMAPKELRRVIPELHTAPPIAVPVQRPMYGATCKPVNDTTSSSSAQSGSQKRPSSSKSSVSKQHTVMMNIRDVVYPREDVQQAVFGTDRVLPKHSPPVVESSGPSHGLTMNSFFS